MKRAIWLITTVLMASQDAEVIELQPNETEMLKTLRDNAHVAWEAYEKTLDKMCSYQAAIKKQRKLVETSGGCGTTAWSTELTGSKRSRWDLSKDFRYLINTH